MGLRARIGSPDRAQRNPGSLSRASKPFPDCVALHPGYAYCADLTRLVSNIALISAIALGVSLSARPCASMHLSIFRL